MSSRRDTFGGAPHLTHFKNRIKSSTRRSKNASQFESSGALNPSNQRNAPKKDNNTNETIIMNQSPFEVPQDINDDELSSRISDVINYKNESNKKNNYNFTDDDNSNPQTRKTSLHSFILPGFDPNSTLSARGVRTYNSTNLHPDHGVQNSKAKIKMGKSGQILRITREFLTTPQRVEFRKIDQVPEGVCVRCRSGQLQKEYTSWGLCLAVFCFPCGIICCLLMPEQRCDYCGFTCK